MLTKCQVLHKALCMQCVFSNNPLKGCYQCYKSYLQIRRLRFRVQELAGRRTSMAEPAVSLTLNSIFLRKTNKQITMTTCRKAELLRHFYSPLLTASQFIHQWLGLELTRISSQLCSVTSHWQLDISSGVNIYTVVIGKYYKSRLLFVLESWLSRLPGGL